MDVLSLYLSTQIHHIIYEKNIFSSLYYYSCFSGYAQKTNPAPSKPVTDEYHGVKVVDEYRNLEDLKDPATINWMKSQTDYANTVLTSIPNRDYYFNKREDFEKRVGYSVLDLRITRNNKYFYLKRNAGEKAYKVYFRNGFNGDEIMLYDPESFTSSKQASDISNSNFVINTISPSWDGSKIAISITNGGRELSEVIVMDVGNKYIHPEIMANTNPANIGGIKWLDDNIIRLSIYNQRFP